MSFLEVNKAILQQLYPGLWDDLISADDNEFLLENIKIEATPVGELTFCVNGIFVHSPRDPVREGQRLIDAVSGEKGAVVIFGFGLGYAAQAAASLNRPIIIIEKYKSLFLKALELRDFSDLFSKSKLIFIIGGSTEAITNALILSNDMIRALSGSGDSVDNDKIKPCVIRNKALMGLDEKWYKAMEDRLHAWAMKDDVNTATHKRFGKRWVRNLIRNMSCIRDLPGISHLEGLINNSSLPVFLAAAGPSLDKIKPLLHDIYERCVIVAVDTSLSFFVKNGIQPDFVLVIDPQYWNSRHLDRCIFQSNNGTLGQTALIAEPSVYPPVLNLPVKNRFLCSSLFPLGTYMENQVDQKGRLAAGGSVATSAWDFSRLLGAREIWIAGLDLAFPDFKTHFRGARFEEKSNSESYRLNPVEKWIVRALRDGFPFKARCINGDMVLTDKRLSLYAAWFENQFSSFKNIKNYCLFQDGLAISGLEYIEKDKFLELPKRRDEIDKIINTSFLHIDEVFNKSQEKREREQRYDKAVSALNRGLISIKLAADEGTQIIKQVLNGSINPSRKDKVLKELDEIMQRLSKSDVKEIAGFLIPQIEEDKEEKDPFYAYLKSSLKLLTAITESVSDMNL